MRVETIVCLCAATVCLATPLSAQGTPADGPVLVARPLDAVAGMTCTVPAGTIRFIGWDRDSIVIRGTSSRSDFFFASSGTGTKLVVEDGQTGEAKPLHLVIYFPRHGKVTVRTVSADITSTDLAGIFVSVSGAIRVSGAASSVEAETMDGILDLDVTAPWIRARTGQGRLLLRGAPQDVDASTVAGALDIATSAILRGRFTSVTGDIRYAATPAPASLFEFSSHGGAVDFLLPRDASARFDVSTVTGAIENGFVQARPAAAGPHSLRLALGRGESQLTVRTFKGTIRLRPR